MSMLLTSSELSPALRATSGPFQNLPAFEIGSKIRCCPQFVREVINRKPPTRRAVISKIRDFILISSVASRRRPAPVQSYAPWCPTYRSHSQPPSISLREATGCQVAPAPPLCYTHRASWRVPFVVHRCKPQQLDDRTSYNFQFQPESPPRQLRWPLGLPGRFRRSCASGALRHADGRFC